MPERHIHPRQEEEQIKNNPEKSEQKSADELDLMTADELLKMVEEGKKFGREVALKLIDANQGWQVVYFLEKFPDVNHQEIALKLIEAGDHGIRFLVQDLEKFQGLDHREIALKIIKAGYCHAVLQYIDNFKGLNHQEIAMEMVDYGAYFDVIENLEKFKGLNHQELAMEMIGQGGAKAVADCIDRFSSIDYQQIADKLIEQAHGYNVVYNLEKFPGINHRELAMKLIDYNETKAVVFYLEKFKGLDHREIAMKIIEGGGKIGVQIVANYLEKFQGLNQKIAMKLMEGGFDRIVARHLNLFGNINQEVVLKLIEYGCTGTLAEYLFLFPGDLNQEVAVKLIDRGFGWTVASNFDKFQGLNHREIAMKLIDGGERTATSFIQNLQRFKGLDLQEIADKLIEIGKGEVVANYLEQFQGINYQEIILKLIDARKIRTLLDTIDWTRYSKLNWQEIADRLIATGEGGFVVDGIKKEGCFDKLNNNVAVELLKMGYGQPVFKFLHKFSDFKPDEKLAVELIENGNGEVVANYLEHFQGINYQEIADKLCANGREQFVVSNINKFQGVNHREIALKAIEAGYGSSVAYNLFLFHGLNQEIALKLIEEAGGGRAVAEKLEEIFQDIDYQKIGEKLLEVGDEQTLAQNLEKFPSINHNELARRMVEKKGRSLVLLSINLSNFHNLDAEIASEMIKMDFGGPVASLIDRFQGIDYRKIAMELIINNSPRALVNNLEKFPGIDYNFIALELFRAGCVSLVADNLYKFYDLDSEVAMKLIEEGQYHDLVENLYKFQNLDHRLVALKLIETGRSLFLSGNIDNFHGLDKEIGEKLIAVGSGWTVVENVEKFPGIKLDKELALELITSEHEQGYALAHYLYKFEGLDHREMADMLISVGQGNAVVGDLENFQGINHREIILKMFQGGDYIMVANNLEKFKGLEPSDYWELAVKMIAARENWSLINNLEKFKGIEHSDIAGRLIESGDLDFVIEHRKKFSFSSLPLAKYEKAARDEFDEAISKNDFRKAVVVNEFFDPPLDDILSDCAKVMGVDFVSAGSYQLFKDIDAGQAAENPEAAALGVKHSGSTGRVELQRGITNFKNDIFRDDFDWSRIKQNRILTDLFKSYVRFETSEWGNHENESFDDLLSKYLDIKDRVQSFSPEDFPPSGLVGIKKIDAAKQDEYSWPEDFCARYKTLVAEIKEALRRSIDGKLMDIVRGIRDKRKLLIEKYKEKIAGAKNDKMRANLEKLLADLQSLDFSDIRGKMLGDNWQKTFTVLSRFKEMEHELLQSLFYYSFRNHPEQQTEGLDSLDPEKPSVEDISAALRFIDHIVNQETFAQYFTEPQAAKNFTDLVRTASLEKELSRAQNYGGKSGQTKMRFIPSRNFMTEVSGHIADACWASNYRSILQEFPNITSVIFRQNEGTKFDRLAGASLLLESRDKNGTPLLIIRGLNPIENTINALSAEDFFAKFIGYVKDLANKKGCRLAIVMDDHSGGAGTNRPVLFNYMEKYVLEEQKLKKVEFNPEESEKIKFNDYNISHKTYYLD